MRTTPKTLTPGEEALATALDNLNAAFGTGTEMPIDPWNVRSLADLAEIGGRQDIADCLRDALKLIADEQPGHGICLENAELVPTRDSERHTVIT